MPKVNIKNGKGVIVWNEQDWLSGLVPNYGNNTYTVNSLYDGMSWNNAIDPNRIPGFLMPGVNPTDITGVSVIDAIQKNVVNNGTNAYSIGGTKVHHINLSTNAISGTGSWPHTITAHGGHSSVVGQDVALYYVGSTQYLFYSWSDNTDGDVGRFDLSSTFDDDYMSTVPTGGAALSTTNNHPLIVGDDDILYIGDGPNLHAFDGQDGANGTLSTSVLPLPKDYIITSFAKLPNFLVVFAYKSRAGGSFYNGESTAFLYDYNSDDPTYSYDLNGNYVNGGFNYDDNQVGCFVRGKNTYLNYNRQSKMMLFTGSGFKTIVNFSENIPGHGGVSVSDENIMWNAGGKIYQYGSPHIGFDKKLNRIAELDGTTTEGLLANLSGNLLLASSGTTTSGGFESLNADYDAAALARVAQVHPSFSQSNKARFDRLVVNYGFKASTGHKAKMVLLYDGQSAEVFDNGNETTADEFVEEYYNMTNGANINFFRIGWELTYNIGTATDTPDAIRSIELYFTEIKK